MNPKARAKRMAAKALRANYLMGRKVKSLKRREARAAKGPVAVMRKPSAKRKHYNVQPLKLGEVPPPMDSYNHREELAYALRRVELVADLMKDGYTQEDAIQSAYAVMPGRG